jgi:hypothetical protein
MGDEQVERFGAADPHPFGGTTAVICLGGLQAAGFDFVETRTRP